MLAFPTFVQQSVAVNARRFAIPDDETTWIRRASEATGFALRPLIPLEIGSSFDCLAMFQATNGDDYNATTVTGNCQTSICTFEHYKTLSLFVTTKDVTNSLISGNTTIGGELLPPTVRDSIRVPQAVSNATIYSNVVTPVANLYDWLPLQKGEPKFPELANVYLVFLDLCKVAGYGNSISNTTYTDVKVWTALKAEFRACVQTFNSSYEGSFQTNILTKDQDLQWTPFGGQDCTTVAAPNDTCITRSIQSSIQRSLSVAYNISGNRLEDFQPGDSQLTPVLREDPFPWKENTNDFVCNDPVRWNSFEMFEYRVENIAASVTMELRNTDYSPTAYVNGTAWLTGT
jgi:hypothetical protein